jgi:hypothetical protein
MTMTQHRTGCGGLSHRSSRPCTWNVPRPRDARHMTHGIILPMEQPGLLARWFGRRG